MMASKTPPKVIPPKNPLLATAVVARTLLPAINAGKLNGPVTTTDAIAVPIPTTDPTTPAVRTILFFHDDASSAIFSLKFKIKLISVAIN